MRQTYGLKTSNCPMKIKGMDSYERDLWHLVSKRKKYEKFIATLIAEDNKTLIKSKKLCIFAESRIKKKEYNLTMSGIPSMCKKIFNKTSSKVNGDVKEIIQNKELVIVCKRIPGHPLPC